MKTTYTVHFSQDGIYVVKRTYTYKPKADIVVMKEERLERYEHFKEAWKAAKAYREKLPKEQLL